MWTVLSGGITGLKYYPFISELNITLRAKIGLEDRGDYEHDKVEIKFEGRNNRQVILVGLSLDSWS